jgi:hypothetical protein
MRTPIDGHRGQTMVELALILPLFTMVLTGIIVLGIGIFYQQQLTNAAREAARFAAIHSATADCPMIGSLDPAGVDPETGYSGSYPEPISYTPDLAGTCYDDWSPMVGWMRQRLFGLSPATVHLAVCWSSYHDTIHGNYDAPPPGDYEIPAGSGVAQHFATTWAQCTIDGQDPTTNSSAIGCAPSLATDDTGSSMSEAPGIIIGNRVTAYACYRWTPPLAGFLLIPGEVVLRGVVTEPIQRQQ